MSNHPAPTLPPHPREIFRALRRQEEDDAETKTCGYIDGELASSVTCDAKSACAHNDGPSVFGCCATPIGNELDCVIQTTCVDFTAVQRTSDTDLTLYCTQSAAGMCQKYTDSDSYSGWACGTAHATLSMAVSGEIVSGFPAPITGAGQVSASVGRGFGNPNPSMAPATTVAQTSDHAAPSSSSSPVSTSSSSPSNSTNPASSEQGNSSLSTGAIAGIAVGGAVLAIAGIITIIFLLYRRHKNKRNEEAKVRPQFQGQTSDQNLMPAGVYSHQMYNMTDMSPLNPGNLDQHLMGQWDGMRPRVAQKQSATRLCEEDDDGLSHKPELRPEDAAGELQYDMRSQVFSEAGRTALYPASESAWPQLR